MFKFFFAVFFILPLAEIYVLLKVGGLLGVLPTVGLVIFTAVLGAVLIRAQGLVTFFNFQKKLAQGAVPAKEIMTGVALLVAGAFLMTPGFVTDTFGFLLLVPSVRSWLFMHVISRWFKNTSYVVEGSVGSSENPKIIN